MMNAYPLYTQLVRKLTAYHHKKLMNRLISGLFLFIQWAIISSLLIISAEALFHFDSRGRFICLAIEGFSLLIPMIIWILPPLVERIRPRVVSVVRTAMEVGAHFKQVNDRLANALELIEKSESQRRLYSLSLIEESLKRAATELEQEDFTKLISTAPLTKRLRNTGIVLLAALLFLMGFQAHTNDAVLRLMQPHKNFADKAGLQFFIRPGDLTVLKGDPVALTAVLSDSTLSTAELVVKSQSGTKVIPLKKAAGDSFRYQVESVRDTLDYFFRAKEQQSPLYHLFPVERPFLRSFKAFIQPPAYSRRSSFYGEDNVGDVTALKGSVISLSGFISKEIEQGYLQFSDSVTLPLQMQNLKFDAAFTLVQDDRYSFHLIDSEGYQNSARIQYRVNIIPDNFPFVDIVIPGKDVDLNDDMILPLAIQAQDDFGISRIRLGYQVLSGGLGELDSTLFAYRDIQGYESNSDQIRVLIQWDLNAMEMFPEDVLLYFVEAFDNDTVSGPKKGSSKIYRARFPSLYEM
ncbi:MAG: hypothetical protein EHM72_18115, partial [Calditrichaeota bacterium]